MARLEIIFSQSFSGMGRHMDCHSQTEQNGGIKCRKYLSCNFRLILRVHKVETMTNWSWIENLDRVRRISFQWLTLASPEKLAIDLGAANTRVYVPGEGVTLDEPSVIAFDSETNKMVAVGRDARSMARCQ